MVGMPPGSPKAARFLHHRPMWLPRETYPTGPPAATEARCGCGTGQLAVVSVNDIQAGLTTLFVSVIAMLVSAGVGEFDEVTAGGGEVGAALVGAGVRPSVVPGQRVVTGQR